VQVVHVLLDFKANVHAMDKVDCVSCARVEWRSGTSCNTFGSLAACCCLSSQRVIRTEGGVYVFASRVGVCFV
jgi:hypothetical protein